MGTPMLRYGAPPIVVADPSGERWRCCCSAAGPWSLRGGGGIREPHRLCGYLFGVASAFSAFYREACPVLKAETDDVRRPRMALGALTLRVLVEEPVLTRSRVSVQM
ncbi:MAG: hypothetical protein IPO89_01530 [Actinomycetales bacterium]|nr:hypothetical protein [Candidatus Lutibacillus vidarii]